MLSAEENRIFTEVGPGTPGGEWLRRYWHPIAISDQWDGIKDRWDYHEPVSFNGQPGTVASWGEKLGDFTGKPTPVRILGEDLVLFRDGTGNPGLIGRNCPHRGASLEFGRVREDGIECCYHGWRFDVGGNCIAMPAEPADSAFKDKVKHTAYPVRELGGLLWAYLGSDEPPILPKFDLLAYDDGVRVVENFGLWPLNYFQHCENSVDQSHTAILHGGAGGERSDIWGTELPQLSWEPLEFGIKSTQARPGINNVRVSVYVFPTMQRLAQPWPGAKLKWPRYSAIWRTPVDDHNMLFLSVCYTPAVGGKLPDLPEGATFGIADQLYLHREQDYQAMVSQGAIFDRSTEKLGTSDAGVILFRKLVRDGIEAVRDGKDPIGVWRDPKDDKIIDLTSIVTDDHNRIEAA